LKVQRLLDDAAGRPLGAATGKELKESDFVVGYLAGAYSRQQLGKN
jgi:hypothetical protein